MQSHFAEIAQLVEHDLAKVGVASSSLVFRSKKRQPIRLAFLVGYETRAKRPQSPPRGQPQSAAGGGNVDGASMPETRLGLESRFPLHKKG